MSRSTPDLPGTTVYQVELTVWVVLLSVNRNGVSDAAPAVLPLARASHRRDSGAGTTGSGQGL